MPDFYLKQQHRETQVCMQLTSLLVLSLGPWSPWSTLSSGGHPRHHPHLPVWPQRAAGKGQRQYLPGGDRLPGLPAGEPEPAPGGSGLRSCQPPIVSGTQQFQQLLPRQWARRIYSWTEPESSLSSVSKQGLLFIEVHGLLTAVISLLLLLRNTGSRGQAQ